MVRTTGPCGQRLCTTPAFGVGPAYLDSLFLLTHNHTHRNINTHIHTALTHTHTHTRSLQRYDKNRLLGVLQQYSSTLTNTRTSSTRSSRSVNTGRTFDGRRHRSNYQAKGQLTTTTTPGLERVAVPGPCRECREGEMKANHARCTGSIGLRRRPCVCACVANGVAARCTQFSDFSLHLA